MVSEGWAIAYRYYRKIINEEKTAKINKLGVVFTEPYLEEEKLTFSNYYFLISNIFTLRIYDLKKSILHFFRIRKLPFLMKYESL